MSNAVVVIRVKPKEKLGSCPDTVPDTTGTEVGVRGSVFWDLKPPQLTLICHRERPVACASERFLARPPSLSVATACDCK